MKKIYLQTLLLCLFSFVGITTFAYDCNVDGIYYNLNRTEQTAAVTFYNYRLNTREGKYINESGYEGDVVIPSSITYGGETYNVTGIDDNAFIGCDKLISITIPKNVATFGAYAFLNCDNLQKVIVPYFDESLWCAINFHDFSSNPLMYAGHLYSDENTEITEIDIPSGVTSINDNVFYHCEGLTSVSIPESVTTIGNSAFRSSGISSIIIPNGVTSIGEEAFSYCTSLTSLTIGENVKTIGTKAFDSCYNLATVIIYANLNTVGNNAFYNCIRLSSVTFHCEKIGSWFSYSQTIKTVVIGEEVTSIGNSAFVNCSGLSSISIPANVTEIGNNAFQNCSSLTAIDIPNSVASIGRDAFSGCSKLSSVRLYCKEIGAWFSSLASITTVILGEEVTAIGSNAFENCRGLATIIMSDGITSIGNSAFSGCSKLSKIVLPDNIISIGSNAFQGCPYNALQVKRGTKSLLSLWKAGYEPYEAETATKLVCPQLTRVSATQTSITVKAEHLYDEYRYYYTDYTYPYGYNETYGEDEVIAHLSPEQTQYISLYIAMGDLLNDTPFYITISNQMNTAPISPAINTTVTASSIHAIGSYIEGDAVVTSQSIAIYKGLSTNTNSLIGQTDGYILPPLTGLNPNEQYTIVYNIVATNGRYNSTHTHSEAVKTAGLSLITSQPKVISLGNVIVAAESNLDDEETNVGFEWRRTDWTEDFASNTGGAYLYNGTMEGYIRNLNTDKLWKYRPYYLSNSGTYYYGDWVGLDPTNTSYFEPTVHTYASINIEGNTALVKGYALTGTDKVTVQGFKYWKSVAGAKGREGMNPASSVPSDAMTVEASGQVMTASLTGLDYNSTYHYVAFVTTDEGDTYYGEEQMFETGDDPTGIEDIYAEPSQKEPVSVVARYNMNGQLIAAPQKGVNILRMSDGSVKKVYVK